MYCFLKRCLKGYLVGWTGVFCSHSALSKCMLTTARVQSTIPCRAMPLMKPPAYVDQRYGPTRLVTGRLDDWYRKYSVNAGEPVQSGIGCCAAGMVSFHYVEPPLARFLWQGLRHNHGRGHGHGHDQSQRAVVGFNEADVDDESSNAARMIEQWPNGGHYDQKPRSVEEGVQVLALLRKVGFHLKS